MRTADRFSTITVEGAILPPDLLKRVADNARELDGLSADSYMLAGEKLNEAISRAWSRARTLWANFRDAKDRLPATDDGTRLTRDKWLLPLFKELDYGLLSAAHPYVFDEKAYPASHEHYSTLIHLVGFRQDLDKRAATTPDGPKMSPHGLVQELLNRSKGHLWAFVSNGLQLRILRDSAALTRQSFVEFDLESMLRDEVYPDFVLFWMLCHASRVRAERPEECWLEKWSKAAQAQGTRALDQLRDGVEKAITALGQGFLQHPENRDLRAALERGALTREDYYRQLLRLVYRLIFLFVAEDRDLLLMPAASAEAKARFRRFYGTQRLRSVARTVRGTPHGDLWQTLVLVMGRLGHDEGCPDLGLPALGSFLWSLAALGNLHTCQIGNRAFLDAIRALDFTEDHSVRRFVDYRNLGAEELGSIYESLLELFPDINLREGGFSLRAASGNERKSTGSYYTPTSLVTCLLDSALDPVLDEASRKPDPEAALLALKVVDPACGSGHFLIAASHRIAKRLAFVRTGNEEPSPADIRHALRDVIGHCIHGVDINEMAVELCKVSLWMEALEPGKPLNFLDSKIRVGNALIGATPALVAKGIPEDAFQAIEGDDKKIVAQLKKRNKAELGGQTDMFVDGTTLRPPKVISQEATQVESLPDDSIQGIHAKEQAYQGFEHSAAFSHAKLLADTWCAAFVWKKTTPDAITTDTAFKLAADQNALPPAMRAEVERLTVQYKFFHWHLGFPLVFRVSSNGDRPNEHGWIGGFDVVLGNPPWERVKLQEKEWFASRRPDIAEATNASHRKTMIEKLAMDDPALSAAFFDARRQAEAEGQFVLTSRRFPFCGCGDVNTYALFAEWNLAMLGDVGLAGFIVPSGIATDNTTRAFFRDIVDRRSLVRLYSFGEIREFFPGSESRNPFALVTLGGRSRRCEQPELAFDIWDLAEMADPNRRFSLRADEFALLNPNTGTCPTFRTRRDAEITKRVYRRLPVLVREDASGDSPWAAQFARLLDMTNDSGLFKDRAEMEKEGWRLERNVFVKGKARYVPLYEAKMVHHFDHRLGTYDGQTQAQSNQGILPRLTPEQHAAPDFLALPWFWVSEADLDAAIGDKWGSGWFLGWRAIARSTDERTMIPTVFPRHAVGNSEILLLPKGPPRMVAALAAALSSVALDYCTRQKLSGTNLNFFTVRQLPVPPPEAFQVPFPWLTPDAPAIPWFTARMLELTYTAHDMAPFARDLGYDGPPFRWDDARRTQIRAELDAAFLHLYGLDRSDAEWVLDSFPVLKKNEESKLGEFRTKRLVLAMYDAMAEAQRTATAFASPLTPPPADPRAAHPATTIAPATARPGATASTAPPPAVAAPPAPTTPSTPTVEPPLAPILPFRKVDRPKPKDKYRTCIPVESIKAAAGAFSDVQERTPTEWAEVTTSTPLAKGMFIAQVEGHSMEPDIPHGAWCIFQRPWLTPKSGEIGIFQLHESTDPDTGAHVTVKKYAPTTTRAPEGHPHLTGTLTPTNPAFTPIPITEEVRPYAKLIEVLRIAI
jgi:SOS-response transcriptional repressor LexA